MVDNGDFTVESLSFSGPHRGGGGYLLVAPNHQNLGSTL